MGFGGFRRFLSRPLWAAHWVGGRPLGGISRERNSSLSFGAPVKALEGTVTRRALIEAEAGSRKCQPRPLSPAA